MAFRTELPGFPLDARKLHAILLHAAHTGSPWKVLDSDDQHRLAEWLDGTRTEPYGDDLLDDWKREVENGDTRLGYQEWRAHLEEAAERDRMQELTWLAHREREDPAHGDEPWPDSFHMETGKEAP